MIELANILQWSLILYVYYSRALSSIRLNLDQVSTIIIRIISLSFLRLGNHFCNFSSDDVDVLFLSFFHVLALIVTNRDVRARINKVLTWIL